MAKAVAGKTAKTAVAKAAVAAAAAPRLVGDEGPGKVEQSAQDSGNESGTNQALNDSGGKEKIGDAQPAPGADNNGELAYLKAQYLLLAGAVIDGGFIELAEPGRPKNGTDVFDAAIAALGDFNRAQERAGIFQGFLEDHGIELVQDEDLFAAAQRIIEERGEGERDLVAKLETYRARDERLLATLAARDGFALKTDESVSDAAIRLLLGLGEIVNRQAGEIAELARDPEGGEAAKAARKDHKAAVKGLVDLLEDLPETAAITLRFGEEYEFSRTIPARDIGREELTAEGSKAVLQRRIEFGPDLPSQKLTSAWLIAGRKTLLCAIPGGLRVGGGVTAAIPAGHLAF